MRTIQTWPRMSTPCWTTFPAKAPPWENVTSVFRFLHQTRYHGRSVLNTWAAPLAWVVAFIWILPANPAASVHRKAVRIVVLVGPATTSAPASFLLHGTTAMTRFWVGVWVQPHARTSAKLLKMVISASVTVLHIVARFIRYDWLAMEEWGEEVSTTQEQAWLISYWKLRRRGFNNPWAGSA